MARSETAKKKAPRQKIEAPKIAPVSNVDRRIVLTDPEAEAAEAIRVLRARIQSQHLQLGRRALAICGPTPEVGATFIAVNLAIAFGNNLSGWTTAAVPATSGSVIAGSVTVAFTITDNADGSHHVVASIPHSGAAKFFARLQVVKP